MNKQIEEMARTIFESHVAIDGIDLAFSAVHGADMEDSHFMRIAGHLYRNGYRKASDVAAEIFAEIELLLSANMSGEFRGDSVEWFDYYELHLAEDIAKLKKKFTEVQGDET